MNICFASLRKRINYTDVLEYGMDVFYECFRYYKDNNKDYDFTYYNFAWGSKGAERDISVLKDADIVVFPAVQEFIYFAEVMHPRDVEKMREKVRELFPYLNNKHIILMTQDRHVNEELIMTKTFEGKVKPKSFQTIDEMDFTCCLKGLKYHWIQKQYRIPTSKTTDFVYWGSDKSKSAGGKKSGDERLNIIKSIRKLESILGQIGAGHVAVADNLQPCINFGQFVMVEILGSSLTTCLGRRLCASA